MNEHDLLNQALETSTQNSAAEDRGGASPGRSPDQDEGPKVEFTQWSVGANDEYRPTGKSAPAIPPGVYRFDYENSGIFMKRVRIVTDELIILPDSSNERVLRGMKKFWASKQRYIDRGLLYKRGCFLWGPPGGGKTATLQLLMNQLVSEGGIVIMSLNPTTTVAGLSIVRRIEPTRNIIAINEDIDEIISTYGESELLSLLDGESQIDNIVHIATSNYPDRLGARIVNRPSRFDERIFVDMPSPEARETYLRKVASDLDEPTLAKWVTDTDKMSVAHLRELAAAVLCLDQDYEDVIVRLRSMKSRVKETSGFSEGPVGFSNAAKAAGQASLAPCPPANF